MEYGSEPLLKPNNKYQLAFSQYKSDYESRSEIFAFDENNPTEQTKLEEFESESLSMIGHIFRKECERLNKNNIYFYGCSFENYKHNYGTRLTDFKTIYTDADESDFIESELKLDIRYFITAVNKKQINFSIQKRNDFLNNKKSQLTTHPQQTETEPINEAEPEQKLPYKIALLYELGFLKLDAIKNLTKENQYKIISKITGGTHRSIKGNVNVLDPSSNEDRIRYTSNNYTDEVKDYLDKLK